MTVKRICLLFIGIFALGAIGTAAAESTIKRIVMCRPLLSQIKNIVFLVESGILPVKEIQLQCVYHEDERTSYAESRRYVLSEGLTWVRFQKIRSRVAVKDLFKQNAWSERFRDLIRTSHGIIFTGGMDVPPAIYGEKNRLITEATTPYRSYYEISFLYHLVGRGNSNDPIPILKNRPDYPVLAICLGSQSLNIAAGGSLIQDIPSEVYRLDSIEDVLAQESDRIHSIRYLKALYPAAKGLFSHFHRIRLQSGSIFERIGIQINDTPYVLSSHHQSVERIGNGLKVIATSLDGKVVEALAHQRYRNVLGVQFHPEVYKLFQKRRYYKTSPYGKADFNPATFLETHHRSMAFHLKIWDWFGKAL